MRCARALAAVALAACGTSRATPPAPPADAAVSVAATPADAAPTDAAPACVCPTAEAAPAKVTDQLTLTPATYADLPGWAADHQAEALPAFLASCGVLAKLDDDARIGVDASSGRARDWRHACAAAAKVPAGDDAAARAFFEAELTPYAASGKDGPDGKMTAYAVQELHGSRTRHGAYQTPLYARPPDLVSVDLTEFLDDARGRRIWGRLDPKTGAVHKFPTRKQIRLGALAGQGLELLWVDDRVDAIYAEIEGSGKVLLDDGSTVWIEFAGKNGRGYKGVGKALRDMGELPKGTGTMQNIRAWFDAHPDRFDEVVDQDEAVVFFTISEHQGGVGSQGVVLTPRRSAAVDRAFVAASTPLWIDTKAPVPGEAHEQPWQHLLIAQDTGGGILGPVRADLYMGDDRAATEIAGRMGAPGRWWLLLPKRLRP